jgi:hypothetical protein
MNSQRGLHSAFLFFALLSVVPRAMAQEATLGEEPAPFSVRGLSGPFAKALDDRIEAKALFPFLKFRREQRAPFLRDARASFNPRTYYFRRQFPGEQQSEAWALGGAIKYETGWYRERLSFGAAFYHSHKLVGDEDQGGTLLLAPGQEDFSVLGEAYAALRHGEHEATFYRQTLDLPYVNKQDNRMAPNTFEAYMLKGAFENVPAAGAIRYGLGYVARIKQRNADTFISMTQAAGVDDRDRGLVMAGGAVQPNDAFLVGAINHFVDDTLNIFYTEADYHHALGAGVDVRYQGQFTHQQSVGDDLLTGSDFDTSVLGGRVAASCQGVILKAAFSTTDNEDRIRSPYGSYPGYLSLMQSDFNRAGEDAWLVGASVDFVKLGLDGLSMFMNYAQGSHARDADTGASLPDRREFDITADLRLQEGMLRNLWLRVRWSTLHVAGEPRNTDDFRVIVNYVIPVL